MSFQRRLFLLLLAMSWLLVACFVAFQYSRERHYKAAMLDGQLQLLNMHLLDGWERTGSIAMPRSLPFDRLRVSVVDRQGRVLYDNATATPPTANHLGRPEIADALRTGRGYTIERHSQSSGIDYFYSALRGRDVVVRTAVPYSVPLREVLRADSGFLWFMGGMTLLISLLGYVAARAQTREHRAALDAEHDKARLEKQLTNNINHELKTPLAAMQVCLETLIDHPDIAPERRADFLRRAYDSGERLRHLLQDVSAITRMDDGRAKIEMRPVSLPDIVAEAVEEGKAAAPQFTFRTDCPAYLTIDGNATQLASLFSNLIANAIAYSGGDAIDITIRQNGGRVRCTFADNGTGIAEEHLPHIFERFYRIDSGRSRKAGGTGLGLAIVLAAVRLHGGDIAAHNKATGGLEYVFSLNLT